MSGGGRLFVVRRLLHHGPKVCIGDAATGFRVAQSEEDEKGRQFGKSERL